MVKPCGQEDMTWKTALILSSSGSIGRGHMHGWHPRRKGRSMVDKPCGDMMVGIKSDR